MELKEIRIFQIDIHQQKVDVIDKEEFPEDFTNYIEGLIELMMNGSSSRTYRFDRDTTEVRIQISRIINNEDFSSISTTIAKRLLSAEQEAQKNIAQLGVEIQKGIVVQTIVEDNGTKKFIICKADHNEFLSELTFTLSRGLPIKKKIFKGFICSLNEDNTVSDNFIYDSLQSKYWWSNFLELTKMHSDEDNTQNAFDAIEKGVLLKLKKKYPQDYMHLSNSNIRYFRSKNNFDLQEYISEMFDNYLPFNEELKIDKLKKEISNLPTQSRKPFDQQFSIIKNKIKKRFIKEIPLTPQIELHFKEEVPNLERIVTAEQGPDGTKYVKIKSEQGYQYFSNRKIDDN